MALARKLAGAAFLCRRLVGVLIDRKGEVRFVMIGDATRLYLPDIGRLRGSQDRLRGLRLVVARPTPLPVQSGNVTLSHDFKTDLEKLRLDAVLELDASRDNVDGPLVLGYLSRTSEDDTVTSTIKVFRSIHTLKEPFEQFIAGVLEDLKQVTGSQSHEKAAAFSDRAILVGVYSGNKKEGLASMDELLELARSARVHVVEKVFQWRSRSYPKTFIGPGKLEEICLRALSLGVEMLIFDRDLSPSQLMNITNLTDLKILDRTMLILDIFAQRAVTREGKVQVEMAQLTYSLPRLFEKQTGLSRLTGGIGGRGPGETKLEVNRRRVKERLARLKEELETIKKQRDLRRRARTTHGLPTLAIVGYTNAGKSTLINALSGSEIYAKDELFATLDPHSRRLRFPKDTEVLVTDTVGFINHLPDSLMQAFMATLEELNHADLLLHVVDIANDNYVQQISVVEKVLADLKLDDRKTLMVLNKIDKLSEEELELRKKTLGGILISAGQNIGLEKLIHAASDLLFSSSNVSPHKSKKFSSQHAAEVVFDAREKSTRRVRKKA